MKTIMKRAMSIMQLCSTDEFDNDEREDEYQSFIDMEDSDSELEDFLNLMAHSDSHIDK